MPRWFNSFRVTRVSSAAIKSAFSRVSRQRMEISPRLPMGVGTKYSIPAMACLLNVIDFPIGIGGIALGIG